MKDPCDEDTHFLNLVRLLFFAGSYQITVGSFPIYFLKYLRSQWRKEVCCWAAPVWWQVRDLWSTTLRCRYYLHYDSQFDHLLMANRVYSHSTFRAPLQCSKVLCKGFTPIHTLMGGCCHAVAASPIGSNLKLSAREHNDGLKMELNLNCQTLWLLDNLFFSTSDHSRPSEFRGPVVENIWTLDLVILVLFQVLKVVTCCTHLVVAPDTRLVGFQSVGTRLWHHKGACFWHQRIKTHFVSGGTKQKKQKAGLEPPCEMTDRRGMSLREQRRKQTKGNCMCDL